MSFSVEKTLDQMRRAPSNVRFADLYALCEHFFGEPRKKRGGSSHYSFKTPWMGDPRVNIQDFKGKAKEYQVKQVLEAVERVQNS